MQYSELYKLDIQKHFADEIKKLRHLTILGDSIDTTNPLWVSAVKVMFNRDCTSRSTSEFLIEKYLPQDEIGERLKGRLNVEVVTLLIVAALTNPKIEQKVLFCSQALPTLTACDIVAVIRKNFSNYELVATFSSATVQRTIFNLIARR